MDMSLKHSHRGSITPPVSDFIARAGWGMGLDLPLTGADIAAIAALVAGVAFLVMHACCLTGQNTAEFQLFMSPVCAGLGR
jgi:hypothetical protein